MTKALEEEIAELEKQVDEAQEAPEEIPVEDAQEKPVVQEEAQEPVEATEQEEQAESEGGEQDSQEDEEQERLKKQAEYRKRIEEKKLQQAQQPQQQRKLDDDFEMDDKALLEELRREKKRKEQEQRFAVALEAGKKEFNLYEGEYKAVYPDYQKEVDKALEFTKMRLTMDGMSEQQAEQYLENEKIMLADRAAAQGLDPVEAVHNEAKKINAFLDAYAEKMGYSKSEKPKTNLQAIREANKPNPMTGGKGANAVKGDFADLESNEVEELTIAQMMSMSKKGEL